MQGDVGINPLYNRCWNSSNTSVCYHFVILVEKQFILSKNNANNYSTNVLQIDTQVCVAIPSANNYENTIRSLELIFNNILAAKTYDYFAFYTHLQFGKLDPLGGEGGGWGLRFVPVRGKTAIFVPVRQKRGERGGEERERAEKEQKTEGKEGEQKGKTKGKKAREKQ